MTDRKKGEQVQPKISSAEDGVEIEYRRGHCPVVRLNGQAFAYETGDEADRVFNLLEVDLLRLRAEREAAMPPLPEEWRKRLEATQAIATNEMRAKVPLQMREWLRGVKQRWQKVKAGQKGGRNPKREPLSALLLAALRNERMNDCTLQRALVNLQRSPYQSLRVSVKSNTAPRSWCVWDEDGTTENRTYSAKALKKLWTEAGKPNR